MVEFSLQPKKEDVKIVMADYEKNSELYRPLFKLWAKNAMDVLKMVKEEGGTEMDAFFEVFKDEIKEREDARAKDIAKKLIARRTNSLREIAEDTGLTLTEVKELAGVKPA